jgi:hypothetical protein
MNSKIIDLSQAPSDSEQIQKAMFRVLELLARAVATRLREAAAPFEASGRR